MLLIRLRILRKNLTIISSNKQLYIYVKIFEKKICKIQIKNKYVS